MDPHSSAQDVPRCYLCETAITHSYCDLCHVNLCKPCVVDHISGGYEKHKIVPFKQRNPASTYPKGETRQEQDAKALSSPPTSREIVRLNVGGHLYTTTMSTLSRYPSAALQNSLQNYDKEGNVFIDRDGKMFEYILGFLRTKKLCLPSNFCDFESLTTEVNYYDIPSLSSCLTKAKQEKLTVQFIEVLETNLYGIERTILKGKAKHLKTILHLGKFDCPKNLEKLSEEESEVLLEKKFRIQLAEILSRNEWTLISSDFSFYPSFSESYYSYIYSPFDEIKHRKAILLQGYRDRWKKKDSAG